ncbi:alpha/beta hydrolase [Spongiimicrobium sp. 3-5]|uniref:alpha/beta hydrolase n=1 Tax=Spongiimicrobium sp. 3-5 TaxID=3332596 RepID=UPI00397F8959
MRLMVSMAIATFAYISAQAQETIKFESGDGLKITADHYKKDGASTYILLFHQAGWSRGEYTEIAPKLNAMGYSCLAVDLRSGGAVNGVKNETHEQAETEGKSTKYANAFPDIEASVDYVKTAFKPKKIILWGSSYSSALVLKFAGDHPDSINGVLSFAPGEYFESKDFITQSAKNITAPVFITSAKNEHKNWESIFKVISAPGKQYYLPKTPGNHGSRALWEKFGDHEGYWEAVIKFLKSI